ncbi:MAG: hypothetical protein MJ092_02170 [Lachnospiraceae bacterium]|nr:hypothetical protein [Lachnospiraceae bacterium]
MQKRPEEAGEHPVKRVRRKSTDEISRIKNRTEKAGRMRPAAEGGQQSPRRTRPAAEGGQQSPRRTRPAAEGGQRKNQRQEIRTGDKKENLPLSKQVEKKELDLQKPTSVKRKKGKKKKTFKKTFLTILITFSAILAAALLCLWFFLSAFEKSRPEGYAKAIINNIEKSEYGDIHLVTAEGLSIDDDSLMTDTDAIASIIESKVSSSDVSYRRLNAESDSEKNVYLVKAGDEALLKIRMVKSDKKFTFGFSDWKEEDTTLLSADLQPKTLKAQIPAGTKLYINGKEVPERFITELEGEIELLSNLRAWGIIGEQPKVSTYTVKGIWVNPEVTYSEGDKTPVVCPLQNNIYTGGFEADQDFINEVYDRVIYCMEPYAYYFSGDAGRGAIASIMLDGSPAYDNATSADVSWMQEHSDVQITEKRAENFKHYSEGVFSCDIGFVETIYQGDEAVKTWNTNMTWIFVRDGDEYYLADFVTDGGD